MLKDEFQFPAELAFKRALDYRKELATRPPRAEASVAELRRLFDVGLPNAGRDGAEVIEALANAAEPGLMGNTGPNFYGWVMGASDPVGVAADWLTSAWGQNSGIYQTSPAAAIAEEAASKWIVDLLRLPEESSFGLAGGATMASVIGLAAARTEVLKRSGWDLEQDGLIGAPRIGVILGDDAHTTILTGLRLLGFGRANLLWVQTDDEGRMSVSSLQKQLEEHQGPAIVISQAGQINTGAFDAFNDIAGLCERHNAWLHVDGAFGLWARAVPDLAHLCDGVERADSWSVDGHKWLQVPYDSGFAIVKRSAAHRRAMVTSASYLNQDPDDGRSPSHFVPELSRRARGFALWAVLQSLGRQGIQDLVSRHCQCAEVLRTSLLKEPGIEVLNDVVLNQLAIGFGVGLATEKHNELVARVIKRIQAENRCYVSGANWKGRDIMRVSIISRSTDIEHIETLAESIIRAWREVQQDERIGDHVGKQ